MCIYNQQKKCVSRPKIINLNKDEPVRCANNSKVV